MRAHALPWQSGSRPKLDTTDFGDDSRLATLLESMPAGVLVLDGDGVIELANRVAREVLAIPLTGLRWRDVAASVIVRDSSDGFEVSLRNERRLRLTTCSLPADTGQILLFQDVTEDSQLRSKIDGVRRLTALGEMMASLAHQIRTPLASALLLASSVQMPSDAAARETMETLIGELRQLDTLVTNMLSFARKGTMDVRPISVSEFIEALSRCLVREGQPVVRREGHVPTDVELMGNLQALESVFHNLVSNAIKAARPDTSPRVDVSLEVADVLFVHVVDNGCGVSEELKDRLFEPFVSGRSDGCGLGLAIALRVIQSHGGELILRRSTPTGSHFSIALPLLRVTTQSHKEIG